MKITQKLVLVLCLVLIINSKTFNKMKPSEEEIEIEEAKKRQTKVKQPFEDEINALFNVDTSEGACLTSNPDDEKNKLEVDNREQSGNLPKKKADPWQSYAKGDAAYLFDHLDDVLQAPITAKLTAIYAGALVSQSKLLQQTSQDPYTYDMLLAGFTSNKFDGNLEANKEKLGEIIKGFKFAEWSEFISVPNLDDVIRKWGWQPYAGDSAKNLLDKYDYNGDGRLDKREFLTLSIHHNIPLFGKGKGEPTYNYDDLFASLIDPMFYFMDCNKDGNLEAEEMWKGLSKLKRKITKYSLFSCMLKLDFEKEYRTISVSDFFLANAKKIKGTLTLDEFRAGLLMGYVKRQIKANKIVTDDSNNKKKDRWNKEGTKDTMCVQIQLFLAAAKPKPAKSI